MPIPLGVLAVAGAGAAAGAGYDLLETTILSTTTASVTFSSLDSYSAYKHLQIRAVMKDNAGSTNLNRMDVRFNSDQGSNYTYHYLNGTGSNVGSSAGTAQSRLQFFDVIGGGSNNLRYGSIILDILDFNNASKNKTVRGFGGGFVASENDISLSSGVWLNTNAITSIEIFGNFNYAAGSRFSLYGIGG
jgi:hypothetical protein